ncbi:MAG: hypothetical protein KDB07_06755, partial [Planctomycetes bacterium]|nr:hypothetical protein [Planctomycetota bacterium]
RLRMDSINGKNQNYWLAGGYTIRDQNLPVFLDNGADSANSVADELNPKQAFFKYQAHFVTKAGSGSADDDFYVMNSTPILNSVSITVLTPPRVLSLREIE